MVTLTEKPRAEVVHFKMDSALDIITRVVMDDEHCYMLAELNLPTDKGRKCRFQILRIVRNDHLETAYVNLGPDVVERTASAFFIHGPDASEWTG